MSLHCEHGMVGECRRCERELEIAPLVAKLDRIIELLESITVADHYSYSDPQGRIVRTMERER